MFTKAKQSIFNILQKSQDQSDNLTIEHLQTCLKIFQITDKLQKFAENFKRLCEQDQPDGLWLANISEFMKVEILEINLFAIPYKLPSINLKKVQNRITERKKSISFITESLFNFWELFESCQKELFVRVYKSLIEKESISYLSQAISGRDTTVNSEKFMFIHFFFFQ